jgi:hypothetical protein
VYCDANLIVGFVPDAGYRYPRRRSRLYYYLPQQLFPIDSVITQNLFPVQIENVLTASPAIREAAVVSVPDAKYGEVVGAWIVLEEAHRGKIRKEDVREIVRTGMNPQVRRSPTDFDSV